MTNGEKLQETFPDIEIVSIVPNEIVVIKKLDSVSTYSNISFTYKWWYAEYKEPTAKNKLGVDCVDRADAIRVASGYCHPSNVAKELAKLPSVTPQEPRWISVSVRCPEENGGYLVTLKQGYVTTALWVGNAENWKEVTAWMHLPKAYSEIKE